MSIENWQFWIGVASPVIALLALIGSAITFFWRKARKTIGYRVLSNASIVDFHKDLDQEIDVVLKPRTNGPDDSQLELPQSIKHARLLVIELKNLGNTMIDKNDFTQSMFRFKPGAVLACGVQTQYVSKGAEKRIIEGLKIDADHEYVEFSPRYLNKNDKANIKIMINENVEMDPVFDIKDGKVVEIKTDPGHMTRRLFRGTAILLLAVLIFSLAVRPVTALVQGRCALDTINVGGSSAFIPVAKTAKSVYQADCPIATINPRTEDSATGMKQLLAGEIQLAFSEIPLREAQFEARQKNRQIEGHPLGLVVFTVIVNVKAGVTTLTKEQIREIYTGKVTNWKQLSVDGLKSLPDLPIRVFAREVGSVDKPGSGTRYAFENHVLQQKTPDTVETVTSTSDMYDKIATTDGAIGYVDLKTAQENAASGNVTVLSIDGVQAATSSANAQNNQYPFCALEYAYTLQNPGALTLSFIEQVKRLIAEDDKHYVVYDKLLPQLQTQYQ